MRLCCIVSAFSKRTSGNQTSNVSRWSPGSFVAEEEALCGYDTQLLAFPWKPCSTSYSVRSTVERMKKKTGIQDEIQKKKDEEKER